MPLDDSIFGEGIYTPREAARLVGGTPQEVLRWTRGSGTSEPLWNAYYQFLDDTTELSFFDLIELRAVKAFRSAGVSLQAIRYAIDLAEEKFGVVRPLARKQFKLDGAEILMEAIEQDGQLVSLSRKRPGQKVFSEIVKQSLSDLEYDGEQVIRWRPGFAKEVVLDPSRSFGTPIIDDYGISTRIIFDEYKQFSNERYLSKIYEIPLKFVNDAIRYERHLESQAFDLNGKSTV